MSRINSNQAKEFLDNISQDDNIAIIHHDDGDGICSGAIYYNYCKDKNTKVEQFTYTINKSKMSDFNLEKFNKLIITDLASELIAQQLSEYESKEILFCDHHPFEQGFPENTLVYVTKEDGYFPAARMAGELTGNYDLLSLIGTMTDAGNLYPENENFIEEKLKKFNMTSDEFQEKISSVISNTISYFSNNPDKVFDLIKNIKLPEDIEPLKKYSEEVEKEIQKFLKEYEEKKERLGDINFYYFEPGRFHVKGAIIYIISTNHPNEIFIFANPSSNDKDKISISARNQSREKDVSIILKEATKDLEDSNAGGHPFAAGAGIRKKDLEEFKDNVRNYVQK